MSIKVKTNFKKFIKELETKAPKFIDKTIRSTVADGMTLLTSELIETTPVDTGRLRKSWEIRGEGTRKVPTGQFTVPKKMVIKSGDTYSLHLHNDVYYSRWVNYGHNLVNGLWWEGYHFLEAAEFQVEGVLVDLLKDNFKKYSKTFKMLKVE